MRKDLFINANATINMKRKITSDLALLPDLDITGMSLPDCVLKIKDLTNYPTDKDDAVNHNKYIAILSDGTGIGISCAREQLEEFISQLIEKQD